MWLLLIVLVFSLIITNISTPLIKKLSTRIGAVDYPNSRRINTTPIPNIGGIAIYLGFLITLLLFSPTSNLLTGTLLGGTFILFLGLIDDLYGISPAVKLTGQIMAAGILIYFGVKIEFITNPFGGMVYLSYWSFPLTILWIVTITNTINLIDGLDGLAAGVATIAVITLFFVALQENRMLPAVMAIALAGSCMGFLKYNFHPAQIFMGDTGAMFTGYVLAAISVAGALKSAAVVTVFVPLLALGIPIFDTLFAIIRRIYNNRPIGKADHGHLHHRLLALGWSQSQAVLIVYAISAILGLMAYIINGSNLVDSLIMLILIIGGIIIGFWKIGIFTVDLPAEGSSLEERERISG
ncbi:MAG: glycosyltransferase family 4 protein [Halanaerobiaceae bacterium]